jgi:hypothetical protein
MSGQVRYPVPQPQGWPAIGRPRIIPGAPEVPQTISGLRLWLAARKETSYIDGNGVATPVNWSGLGNDHTQATGTKQPTYQTNIIDGQPVFRFDVATAREWTAAAGNVLNVLNAVGGATVFIVARRTGSTGATEQFIDFRNNAAGTRFKYGYRFVAANPDRWFASGRRLDADAQVNSTGEATVDTSWHLHTVVPNWSAGTIDFYREQTADATGVAWTSAGTTSATNSAGAAVGSQGGSEYVTGDIAEMLVYDRVLAAGERQAVWDYLLGVYPSLAGGQTIAVGVATEAEAGQALGKLKTAALGQATEAEAGQALSKLKLRALGQAVEVEAGQAITLPGEQIIPVGTAIETEAAPAIAPRKTRAVGQATEAEAGQALGAAKTRALGQATEAEASQALGKLKTRTLGNATEIETGQALGKLKLRTLGNAVELEAGQVIQPSGQKIIVAGPAVETETAPALGRAKARTLGHAAEIEAAQTLARFKTTALGPAIELELAQAVAVAGGTPPPRWVEAAGGGSGLVEATGSGSGGIEAAGSGSAIVESSGGV